MLFIVYFLWISDSTFSFSALAASSGFFAFIIADTTAIPSIGLSFNTPQLSIFSPPIATIGIDTVLQISAYAPIIFLPKRMCTH